ncbi:MAG: glutamine amidotransferase [Salinivirgaceae bacterium]|jgi:GMP synthase (glutamine-hydrolysing)|nr:glutamine amidotransferase [Salinivirgaceae bacterium]
MKKLLIVKTGSTYDAVKKQHGDFEDMLVAAMGIGWQQVEVFNAKDETLSFPIPDDYAGIIITGSHDMLTFEDDWMLDLEEWIGTICDTEVPALGIGFGHQAMVKAFGGKVDYRDWGPEVGYVKIRLEVEAYNDRLFGLLFDKFHVYQYHNQSVVEFPEKIQLLGANNIDFYQVVRYNNHMWSCQFHPEFSADVLKKYIEINAVQLTVDGLDPYVLLTILEENESGKKLLKRFVEICDL